MDKITLENLRNESLFNCFVMFSLVRRKKIEQKNNLTKIMWINIFVIFFSLLSLSLPLLCDKDTTVIVIFSLISLLLSISIFIFFPKDDDSSRIAFNVANSFWIIIREIELIMKEDNKDNISKIESIISKKNLLLTFTPTFKEEDINNALDTIKNGNFLYNNKDEKEKISIFFDSWQRI